VDRQLRAVLFDMDGVLINSSAVSDRLLTEAAARDGVELTAQEFDTLRGTSGLQFWGYIKHTYNLPGSVEEYWASYDAAGEVAAYDPSLVAMGMRELLMQLRAESVMIGLVTSASCWRTEKVIDFLQIRTLLNTRVCANDVVEHKPHPAPYLMAATRLGVEPETCVVIEDSRRGVESALAAGMGVGLFVGFNTDPEALPLAHGSIRDFSEESPQTLRSLHQRAQAPPGP
jgi:HAD superfamily hydrolase (TIGR01509 family)